MQYRKNLLRVVSLYRDTGQPRQVSQANSPRRCCCRAAWARSLSGGPNGDPTLGQRGRGGYWHPFHHMATSEIHLQLPSYARFTSYADGAWPPTHPLFASYSDWKAPVGQSPTPAETAAARAESTSKKGAKPRSKGGTALTTSDQQGEPPNPACDCCKIS